MVSLVCRAGGVSSVTVGVAVNCHKVDKVAPLIDELVRWLYSVDALLIKTPLYGPSSFTKQTT